MTNVIEYREELHNLQAELQSKSQPDGSILLTSTRHRSLTEHRPDVVMPVTLSTAAKLLVRGTHRIASPEEADGWKAAKEDHIREHANQDESDAPEPKGKRQASSKESK